MILIAFYRPFRFKRQKALKPIILLLLSIYPKTNSSTSTVDNSEAILIAEDPALILLKISAGVFRSLLFT